MNKTNVVSGNYLRGTYNLIASKYACSRRYVRKVLENDLGKYADRDTDLVRKIRQEAARLNELFPPEE